MFLNQPSAQGLPEGRGLLPEGRGPPVFSAFYEALSLETAFGLIIIFKEILFFFPLTYYISLLPTLTAS